MKKIENKFISEPKIMLTQEELAARWRVSEWTLEYWRRMGDGPTYRKLGSRPKSPVRYMLADIESYEANMPAVEPLSQNVEAAYDRHTSSR